MAQPALNQVKRDTGLESVYAKAVSQPSWGSPPSGDMSQSHRVFHDPPSRLSAKSPERNLR